MLKLKIAEECNKAKSGLKSKNADLLEKEMDIKLDIENKLNDL